MDNDPTSLARGVDKCVTCGLCVPLCPTWQVNRNEADSPRGRLLIMAQLAQGKMPGEANRYLDACLGCGRCEQVCPNDVPYLDLLPQAKAIASPSLSLMGRLIAFLAPRPYGKTVLGALLSLLRIAHALRLSYILPAHLRQLASTAPAAAKRLELPANKSGNKETVSIFAGCFGEVLDRDALQATANMLVATGHSVSMPSSHLCCGAIAHHAGNLEASKQCSERIRQAIEPSAIIATAATGCAAQLAASQGNRVVEAGALIAKRADMLDFSSAQEQTVLLHAPCTQSHLPGGGDWCRQLLSHIPGLRIIDAPANDTCCGAGGITHLTHQQTGKVLAERKLAAWQQLLGPNVTMLTTNHGCRWHLAASEASKAIPIVHPLTFAWRYVKKNPTNA